MKKHKVLHVIGGGEIGGAEELVLTLLKLLNQDQYQAGLLCLCPGPFAAMVEDHGFKTITIPMKHRLDLSVIKPIRAYIKQEGISLVHTHGVRANLVARIAAKQEKLPVVTTVHSVLRYDYDTLSKAWFARLITALTNRKTDRFIAISGVIRDDILKMGIEADRIKLIHSGLDVSRFHKDIDGTAIRQKLGINKQVPLISVVARLHPVKGHEYFIKACRRLLDAGIKAQFLLAGDGIERPKLEALVRDLNLEDCIFMPGYYSPVEDIYSISDIICLPSLMEGLGLVILEAMYFDVPVIASNTGGIPEIIQDGSNGLLVEPRDDSGLAQAMQKILTSPDLKNRLVQNGQQTVRKFSQQNMARKVEQIYEELLK